MTRINHDKKFNGEQSAVPNVPDMAQHEIDEISADLRKTVEGMNQRSEFDAMKNNTRIVLQILQGAVHAYGGVLSVSKADIESALKKKLHLDQNENGDVTVALVD